MARSGIPVFFRDTVFLYCYEEKGYLYADWPSKGCFSFSPLTLFKKPDENGRESEETETESAFEPHFPSVQCGAFEIWESNANIDNQEYEKGSAMRTLVYGNKIKLRHVATGNFLCFKMQSSEGQDDRQVSLARHTKETGFIFKVIPSHVGPKRQKGEDVQAGDAIKLKCEDEQEKNILCTRTALSLRYELRKADAASAFVVSVHKSRHDQWITHEKGVSNMAIMSGTSLTLYNVYYEANMAAHISIASTHVSELGKRQPVEGSLEDDSSLVVATKPKNATNYFPRSGESFWQLECSKQPNKGKWVEFGEEVHIKHVASQKYIAVTEVDGKKVPVLKDIDCNSESDKEFCFHFVSKGEKEKGINVRDHLVIKHGSGTLVFRTWERLHQDFKKPTSDELAEGFERKFELEFLEENENSPISQYDVFTLAGVYRYVYEPFYHILGAAKFLLDYLSNQRKEKDPSASLMDKFAVEVMTNLNGLMKQKPQDKQYTTLMLRATKAIDLMMLLLRETKHKGFQKKVFELLSECINYGDRQLNKYLVDERFTTVLFEKVKDKNGAEKVLVALMDVDCEIRKKLIEYLERDLDKMEFDSHLLDLLRAMCESEKMPFRQRQEHVWQIITNRQLLPRLTRMPECEDKELKGSNPKLDILIAQLKLFTSLCRGRSPLRKDIMEEPNMLVSFKHANECVHNHQLDPKLRAAFLEFLTFAIIDDSVSKNKDSVQDEHHDSLEASSCTGASTLSPDEKGKVKEKLDELLKECEEQDFHLLNQVLKSLRLLVEYQVYDNPNDVRMTIKELVKAIAHSWKNRDKEDANLVTITALELLQLFFEQFLHQALDPFVDKFFTIAARSELDKEKTNLDLQTSLSLVKCEMFYGNELEKLSQNPKKLLIELMTSKSNKDSPDLIKIKVLASKLLLNIFQPEIRLLEKAEVACIHLEDSEVTKKLLIDFEEMDGRDLFPEVYGLRGSHSLSGDQAGASRSLEQSESKKNEHIPASQRCAYSSGLFKLLLDYVKTFSSRGDDAHEVTIVSACHLLQKIMHKNEQIQRKLFESFGHFQEPVMGGEAVAQLLTEMFTNNKDLCRKVSQSDVVRIFYTASSNLRHHSEFFTTLQAIIVCSKTEPDVNKRFQDVVAKQFSESLHDVFSCLLPKCEKRWSMLTCQKEDTSNPERHQALLNVCSLLSVCTKSGREIPLDICQTLFKLDNLTKILASKRISLTSKKPFASLIAEAHIGFDDASQEAVLSLRKDEYFQKHIKFMATVTHQTVLYLKKSETHLIQRLATLLCFLQEYFQSTQGWEKEVEKLKVNEQLDLGNQETVKLTSALYYILDGFLPMLSALCKQLATLQAYSQQDDTSELEKTQGHISESNRTNLEEIRLNFVELSKVHGIFKDSRDLAEQLTMCANELKSLLGPSSDPQIQIQNGGGAGKRQDYNHFLLKSVKETKKDYLQQGVTHNGEIDDLSLCVGEKLICSGKSFDSLLEVFCNINEKDDWQKRKEKMRKLVETLKKYYSYLVGLLETPQTTEEMRDLYQSLITCLQLLHRTMFISLNELRRQCKVQETTTEDLPKTPLEELQNGIAGKGVDSSQTERLNAHGMIMFFANHRKVDVGVHAMAVLATLLFQGNAAVQSQTFESCKEKNSNVFVTIDDILNTANFTLGLISKSNRGKEPPGKLSSGEVASQMEDNPSFSSSPVETTTQSGKSPSSHLALQIENPSFSSGPVDTPTESSGIEPETEFCNTTKEDSQAQNKWEGLQKYWLECESHLHVALDLLSNLCDHQHTGNQNLLRQQESKPCSVNLVMQVAILLESLANASKSCKSLEEASELNLIVIMEKASKALTEMCSGNYENQQVAFKAQIVTTVISILRCDYIHEDYKQMSEQIKTQVCTMKSHASELIYVMTEATSVDHDELLLHMSSDISSKMKKPFCEVIKQLWKWKDRGHLNKEMKTLAQRGCFAAFHVIKQVAVSRGHTLKCYGVPEKLGRKRWKYLSERSRTVEILYNKDGDGKQEVHTRLHFPFSPNGELSKKEQDFVNANLKRDSTDFKLKSLCDWMKDVHAHHKRKENLKKTKLCWIVETSHVLDYILKPLTLLLNILVIVYFTTAVSGEGSGSGNTTSSYTVIHKPIHDSPLGFKTTFYILGVLHYHLSILMIVAYFIEHYINCDDIKKKIKGWWQDCKKYVKENHPKLCRRLSVCCSKCRGRKAGSEHQDSSGSERQDSSGSERQDSSGSKRQDSSGSKCQNSSGSKRQDSSGSERQDSSGSEHQDTSGSKRQDSSGSERQDSESGSSTSTNWSSVSLNDASFKDELFSVETIYRVLFVLFSFLALGFSGYWYCLCSFYIFLGLSSFHTVLTALRRSAWELIIVLMLILCVLLIYAVFSFAVFQSYFIAQEGRFCATLYQCFITVIHEGLLGSLADAIALKRPEDDTYSYEHYVHRALFDLSFFLLVGIIGLNIVVAVLVDKFSELTRQREAIKEDESSRCFVCGLDNDEFERKGKGFQHHIKEDHSVWNYLYLYLYLKSVDPNDHTALEKHVFDQVERGKIDFFPLKRAKVLEGGRTS